ncbi:hypothetical protein ACFHW1_21595, partial [Micromonospora sp. LOL_014]|uniref:hypothetical protein n=1 Tax=Micromonospora sp. LOL_014 TaxID=3345415 RepID=UPI003A864AD0
RLAPHLNPDQRPAVLTAALDIATTIADGRARAQALTGLVPYLTPSQIFRILEIDRGRNLGVARAAVERMGALSIPALSELGLPIARLAMRQLRRDSCFEVTATLAQHVAQQPIVHHLLKAQHDVHAWWP